MQDQDSNPLILPEEEDIGIPNVPAMIHQAEQEAARRMLDEGYCPIHHEKLVEAGEGEDRYRWEECPICAEREY